MTWYMLVGVVMTLVIVALVVQLFLTWSTKRGWFEYRDHGNQRRTGRGLETHVTEPEESAESAHVSHGPDCRLAVYGTLAPGRTNHHELDGLSGHWIDGTVRGWLREGEWGSNLGYPGIVLDAAGPTVGVHLFESSDLPDHWSTLDDFEGSGYRRTVTTVNTAAGYISAFIYVLAIH